MLDNDLRDELKNIFTLYQKVDHIDGSLKYICAKF